LVSFYDTAQGCFNTVWPRTSIVRQHSVQKRQSLRRILVDDVVLGDVPLDVEKRKSALLA